MNDLEGTTPEVIEWVSSTKTNIHAKFGTDWASSFDMSNFLKKMFVKHYTHLTLTLAC